MGPQSRARFRECPSLPLRGLLLLSWLSLPIGHQLARRAAGELAGLLALSAWLCWREKAWLWKPTPGEGQTGKRRQVSGVRAHMPLRCQEGVSLPPYATFVPWEYHA